LPQWEGRAVPALFSHFFLMGFDPGTPSSFVGEAQIASFYILRLVWMRVWIVEQSERKMLRIMMRFYTFSL